MPKVTVTTALSYETYNRLVELANAKRTTVSALVREAVERFLMEVEG